MPGKISKTCEECGQTFSVFPSRQHARFCSYACSGKADRITADDFWSRTDQSGGKDSCWEWQRCRTDKGYGQLSFGGKRHVYAHRLAYMLATGDDPGELMVCHQCDNPPCCNPSHLFLGTNTDNVADKTAKGRAKFDLPRHGKLTVEIVREMRERHANGERTVALAAEFGVNRDAAGKAIYRRTWKNVA